MKIILRDRNQELVDAWKSQFRNLSDVEIGCGDIFDVSADALVSPANSFGFMNGGIDGVYTKRFGVKLQQDLQKYLLENHNGELVVGEAVYIPIENDPNYKFLISAPTMRVPADITGTVNAYLSFRAVLRLVKNYNKLAIRKAEYNTIQWGRPEQPKLINSILCPGLGTAIGRLPYDVAAAQMREAYRVVIQEQSLNFNDIGDSYQYHEAIRRGFLYKE